MLIETTAVAGAQASTQEAKPDDKDEAEQAQAMDDDPMDGAERFPQNCLVPQAAGTLKPAAGSGSSLAQVAKMGGKPRPQSADGNRAPKARRV